MHAFRAPQRVRPWIVALLLSGCGRVGFDRQVLNAEVDAPGNSGSSDEDAAGPKPGDEPNEPVPEDPIPTLPTGDAGVFEDGSVTAPPAADAGIEPRDAATPASSDAGTEPGDAGTMAPDAGPSVDAGMPDAGTVSDAGTTQDAGTDAGAPRTCQGKLYANVCWYLSGNGESCADKCRVHGGFDSRSASVVGSPSQGGSVEKCGDIFRLLGFFNTVRSGFRNDGAGLGCHRWEDGVLWWLTDPGFDKFSSSPSASRVCGCLE